MKNKIVILLSCALSLTCFAQEIDDTKVLATALNIPTVSTSQVWTTSFFTTNGITINGLYIEKKDIPNTTPIDFIVMSNGIIVAYGELLEQITYEAAYTALMTEFVNSTMSVQNIAQSLGLKNNGIGDFCLIGKVFSRDADSFVEDFSSIHFVRGAKAIRLYGKNDLNVQPLAEMLDALLKSPPTHR